MERTTSQSDTNPAQKLPSIICMRDRRICGWPPSDETKDVQLVMRLPLAGALTRGWNSDAHCTAYDAEQPYRFRNALLENVEAAALMGVRMVALLFDLDDDVAHQEGSPARAEWKELLGQNLGALAASHAGFYAYTTRAGCRVAYVLATPVAIRTKEDAGTWRRFYLRSALYLSRRFRLAADPTCGDWTRLYRLPLVVRDRKRQTPEGLGNARAIGRWTYEPSDSDVEADINEARRLAATNAAWEPVVRLLEPSARRPSSPRPATSEAPIRLADRREWRADLKQRHAGLLSLGGRHRHAGLTGAPLLAVLRAANTERCIPPLDDDSELARMAEWLDTRPACSPPGLEAANAVASVVAMLPEAPIAADLDASMHSFADVAGMLDAVSREVARESMIAELELRKVGAPARLVDAALGSGVRTKSHYDNSGPALGLCDPDPWPDPVEGVALLDELSETFRRHIVVSRQSADACSLWVVHTHAADAAEVSPRLSIVSPVKRCGKTTLIEMLADMARRPLLTANVTTAAVFRAIDAMGPTLLIDEADTFLSGREELRGILNAGHRRKSAFVIRCVGDEHEAKAFAVWAPVAIAAIGRDSIPSTLVDRSIVIQLARRAPHEDIVRFVKRDRGAIARMQRQCARFAQDNGDALRLAPVLDELDDRAADNWGPLLAIADAAGGLWPKRARDAAIALSTGRNDEDDEQGIALLADVRIVFDERALRARAGKLEWRLVDRLRSTELVGALIALDDRPWGESERGRPLTPHALSARLRPFGIKPSSVRMSDTSTPKGYVRQWFTEAWGRYLSQPGANPQRTQHGENDCESGDERAATQTERCALGSAEKTSNSRVVADVADSTGSVGVRRSPSSPRETRTAPITAALSSARRCDDGELPDCAHPAPRPCGPTLLRGLHASALIHCE